MTRKGTGFVCTASLVASFALAEAGAQVKDWEVVGRIDSAGVSAATATASGPDGGVVVAGEFVGAFRRAPLINQEGWDSYVWALAPDGSPIWRSPAHLSGTEGDVRVSSVVVTGDGRIFCGGSHTGALELGAGVTGLPAPPGEQGFVAWCDGGGNWLGVMPVDGMPVEGLAVDEGGAIYVTGGRGEFARKYLQDGVLVWSSKANDGIEAVELADFGGAVYAAGTLEAGTVVVGEETLVLSANPDDPTVVGQSSGVVIESSEAVSFAMRLGAFGGGRVRVVIEDPAGAVPEVVAGEGHLVLVRPNGEDVVEIIADPAIRPDSDVALLFDSVKRLRIEVDFVRAAAEPPGTVIDYAMELTSFNTSAEETFPFDLSEAEGVHGGEAFVWSFENMAGSGVDFHIESVPGWTDGHVVEVSSEAVPVDPVNGARDVFLARLSGGDGDLDWIRTGGSDDSVRLDEAGGVATDAWGRVRFAFAAGGPVVRFAGRDLPGGQVPAGEAFLTNSDGSGELLWGVACGEALQAQALMGVPAVDVDESGVSWVGAGFNGTFAFQAGLPRTGNNDAVLLGIGARGNLFLAEQSVGTGVASALGVARGAQKTWFVGLARGAENFGGIPVQGRDTPGGFLAILGDAVEQGRFLIVPSPAGRDVEALKLALANVRAQPFLQQPQPGGGDVVAVHVRGKDLAAVLALEEVAGIEEDPPIQLSGSNTDAGWALGRLNLGAPVTGGGPWSYGFDDTCVRVRFYLIDTAVDPSAPFVSELAAATLDSVELVRSVSDPPVSVVFEHGTKMLGLVAGAETGVAPASPIEVKNYDVFPSATSGSTYASYLVTAIYRAIADHESLVDDAGGEAVPAVMLLSLTSSAAASSFLLDAAIDAAVDQGITVVVSAGNSGAGAGSFVPASRGTKSGVICVGGCTKAGGLWGSSNHGSAVDLLAPGEAVPVPDLAGGLTTIDGTSASAALVAGAAVLCVATNPDAPPAAVEAFLGNECPPSALGSTAGLPAGTPALVLHVAADGTAGFFDYSDWIVERTGGFLAEIDDEDGDGAENFLEYVRGGNPLWEGDGDGMSMVLSGDEVTVSFTVAKGLWSSGAPGELRDGSSLELESSDDLETWTTIEGVTFVDAGAVSNTRLLIEASFSSPAGVFVRLKATRGP